MTSPFVAGPSVRIPGAPDGPLAGLTFAAIPEIVAEVRALFERYEQALIDTKVEVLDATFWDSPHTSRDAFRENG